MKFYVKEKSDLGYCGDPKSVYDDCRALANADQEAAYVYVFNAKNRLLARVLVALGGIESAMVDPKVVFRRILLHGGVSFVLVHNHPTGNPEPSNDDIRLTTCLKEGARVLDIKMLDHVIVGDNTYFSFREKNVL